MRRRELVLVGLLAVAALAWVDFGFRVAGVDTFDLPGFAKADSTDTKRSDSGAPLPPGIIIRTQTR